VYDLTKGFELPRCLFTSSLVIFDPCSRLPRSFVLHDQPSEQMCSCKKTRASILYLVQRMSYANLTLSPSKPNFLKTKERVRKKKIGSPLRGSTKSPVPTSCFPSFHFHVPFPHRITVGRQACLFHLFRLRFRSINQNQIPPVNSASQNPWENSTRGWNPNLRTRLENHGKTVNQRKRELWPGCRAAGC
jgi:hypothetical protein